MGRGGTLFAMSSDGAEKVVPHDHVRGPVKAALASCVRDLVHELGPEGIRVHAISPRPTRTRAPSGINAFDELLNLAGTRAPAHQLVSIKDVGIATAALAPSSIGTCCASAATSISSTRRAASRRS